MGGGGGYGEPLERPAAQVLEDVFDRKIGLEMARDVYGVVVEDEVIIGAGSLKGWQLYQLGDARLTYDALLSAGLAFAAALIAIAALMAWLKRSGFTPFVLYRIFLGGYLLTAVYGWVG